MIGIDGTLREKTAYIRNYPIYNIFAAAPLNIARKICAAI